MADGAVWATLVMDAAGESRLQFERDVHLPALPRAGDEVYVGPNAHPVAVLRVTWQLEDDSEPAVRVHLDDFPLDAADDSPNVAVRDLERQGWQLT